MRQGHDKKCGQARASRNRAQVPAIWLMTDERIAQADLLHAARRLPRGSAIVLRHYTLDDAARRALFDRLRTIAWRRRCLILLAGDPVQAHAWGADGHHGRTPASARISRAGRQWLHSAPAHDSAELKAAHRAGAAVVLLSPLFATRSHPGGAALGLARFAALARRAPMPAIALGGVRPRHARLVGRLGAAGYAAIDGLIGRG
ncbi:MAG: thiamine phosphate synthase [Sphingobium sp. 66-54]|nr:MAG: thiamine phosphate synthase [Sphingobium sp. 66-54]